jgi:hypothetical protein
MGRTDQAAIPTATPLPPTETPTQTPLPTDTPLPLPTLNVTLTSTTAPVGNNTGGDPCATRVLSPSKGRETMIRVVNTTNVTITVSMYLNETASHGECGYRGFTLSKNNDIATILYKDAITCGHGVMTPKENSAPMGTDASTILTNGHLRLRPATSNL